MQASTGHAAGSHHHGDDEGDAAHGNENRTGPVENHQANVKRAGRHQMKFETVAARLDGLKFTQPREGRELYDFILRNAVQSILEIGFHHGVSTCYMAAALHEQGRGHIITLDQFGSRDKDPNLPELLAEFGLSDYVTPVFAERSYTWELYKLLAADPRPTFDFCFHDADHTWDTTSLAFFCMDKMLRPDGWMLFDDYGFTIEGSKSAMRQKRGKWPREERQTPAVAEVFRLLVAEHGDYGDVLFTK